MVKKRPYEFELWLVKAFPILLAAMTLLQNFLSFTNVDLFAIAQVGGLSFLTLLFVYLSSFAFGFKLSHRILIYFIFAEWIIDIVDTIIGIPISNEGLLSLYVVLFCMAIIATIVLYIKERKQSYIIEGKGVDAGNSRKLLIKYEMIVIKIIPMVVSGICLLNSTLSYFSIDWPILSYLGSMSMLMVVFMYLSSIVFGFCVYHRIFIHYLAFTIVLNVIDWYIDPFPNNRGEVCAIYVLVGIAVFIFARLKSRKMSKTDG